MYKPITKIVLVRRPAYGWYDKDETYSPNDELILLWLYLTSCVGYDPADISIIKQEIINGRTGCDDIGGNIIDGKFQFFHDLMEDLKEPRISPEDLLKLIEKWYELVSAKVDKIVITNDNGTFSIRTE